MSGVCLGSTMQEKTRSLLGWTVNDHHNTRYHPYQQRKRLYSGGSCASEASTSTSMATTSVANDSLYLSNNSPCLPSPAPSTSSNSSSLHEDFVSSPASRDVIIFERLRKAIQRLPRHDFEALLECVSNEMDASDTQERRSAENAAYVTLNDIHSDMATPFPDDLMSVDVTAFKHLILTQPLNFMGRF